MKNFSRSPTGNKQCSGFSLIEMMIIVTIVGILGAMSYSAYTGYTRYADRSYAQSNLYEIAQIMERGFTQTRSYAAVPVSVGVFNRGKYVFSFDDLDADSYGIVATVDQSSDTFDLRLDSNGTESYKAHGGSTWYSGWEIPD